MTGAGGQLGTDLGAVLPDAVGMTRAQLSIADRESVRKAVEGFDIVLNCAADNAVDAAEANPEAAFAVNAEGAGNVAWACGLAGARLVHFSTNFVFDGSGSRPFTEADLPGALGAYGRSKLEGERRVLEMLPESLIVRSSGLFGAQGSAVKGGSFPQRIVMRAEMGERLGFLGIAVDAAQNAAARGDVDVSAEGADVRTLVVTAREDLEIARQVRRALE